MLIRIMGIINANDDSFFEDSRFLKEDAISKIECMISDGATIIDIGAVSSRPGADIVSADEELKRFKPIADIIQKKGLYTKAIFSIDSYTPSVIEYALKSGFSYVNDITGLENDEVCRLVAHYNATAIIMHMQGRPQDMQNKPTYSNILEEVNVFFRERIAKAKRFGIEKIILDVGIGFGKTLEHNLKLINKLNYFTSFGYELLIGASRKSMIDSISSAKVNDRLAGTLVLHVEALRKGASIVRVHDVFEHNQAMEVFKRLE